MEEQEVQEAQETEQESQDQEEESTPGNPFSGGSRKAETPPNAQEEEESKASKPSEKSVETDSTDSTKKPSEETLDPKTKEATTPPASKPKTHKVKIDKEEMDVPEEELIKSYQLAQTSYKRLAEAAKKQKDFAAMLELFDKDPEGVLLQKFAKQYGDKSKAKAALRDMAVKIIQRNMEEEGLSEEERRVRAKEEEYNERERALKQREAELEQQRAAEAQKQYDAELARDLPEAMEKAGLDKENKLLQRSMLNGWIFMDEHGIKPDFAMIAREVKRNRRTGAIELAKTLPPDEFREIFSDQYQAIRKKELDELRKKPSTSQSSTSAKRGEEQSSDKGRARKPGEFTSMSEYSRWKEEQLASAQ